MNYLKIGRRAIHRIVAEQEIGRKLKAGEVVHHINGNILDNRPENLEVMLSQSHHIKYEIAVGVRGKISHDTAVANGKKSGIARREKRSLRRA